MKQTLVFLISLIYWVYLAYRWSFSVDTIGYKELGSIFYHHGLMGYVATGLHREPLYPLVCSWAMGIENTSGMTFTHVMAGFSIVILMVAQLLMYIILRELNIRPWIIYGTLFYWALSTAITNSAFNILLFCEVIAYPFVLGVVIAGYYGWRAIIQDNKKAAGFYGILTGLMFTALTLVKAVFECICPVYLMVFLAVSIYKKKISLSFFCFLAAASLLFYVPVIGYKCLNRAYNGNYAIADRGPINLYGNVARRTGALSLHRYFTSLAFATDACGKYFTPQECSYWDFNVSDNLGEQKLGTLTRRHLPPQAVTDELLRLSREKILTHLPQYILLTLTESLRVYFWEVSVGIIPLHYIMAIVTFFSLLYCFLSLRQIPALMKHVLIIILLFIAFYSLFAIMQRHLLPMVPLYLITISYTLNSLLPKKIDQRTTVLKVGQ